MAESPSLTPKGRRRSSRTNDEKIRPLKGSGTAPDHQGGRGSEGPLGLLDQSGLLAPLVRRTYAPRAKTPIQEARHRGHRRGHRGQGHRGQGHRGGIGPGRSRDYSLQFPQIRACTSNAPGSSRCGIAVPHTTGWFRGDTLVSAMSSRGSNSPSTRGTPFAPRGPEGPFPRFNTTMGRRDPCLHLAALRFLRLAIPSVVPGSSPQARDRAVDQPGVG